MRQNNKAQLVIDPQTGQVIVTAFGQGRTHDFQLWKASGVRVTPTCCLADAGYQELTKSHSHSETPHKKSKLHPLISEQKQANRELSRRRIGVEHVIGKLKVFRILSERCRNHRHRT